MGGATVADVGFRLGFRCLGFRGSEFGVRGSGFGVDMRVPTRGSVPDSVEMTVVDAAVMHKLD